MDAGSFVCCQINCSNPNAKLRIAEDDIPRYAVLLGLTGWLKEDRRTTTGFAIDENVVTLAQWKEKRWCEDHRDPITGLPIHWKQHTHGKITVPRSSEVLVSHRQSVITQVALTSSGCVSDLKRRSDVSVHVSSDSPIAAPKRNRMDICCVHGCSRENAKYSIPESCIVPFAIRLGLQSFLRRDYDMVDGFRVDPKKCTIEQWSVMRFCDLHVRAANVADAAKGLLKEGKLPLQVFTETARRNMHEDDGNGRANNNSSSSSSNNNNNNNKSSLYRKGNGCNSNEQVPKHIFVITFFAEKALGGCIATQELISHFTGLPFVFILRFKTVYEEMQAEFVASDPIQDSDDTLRRKLAPFPNSPTGQLNTFLATMICLKSALPFASVCKFYDVHETTVSTWWKAWVEWGARFLGWMTPLPSLEVCRLMTHPDFYRNVGSDRVRFIVDGVQIRVEDSRDSTGISAILHSVTKNCPTINIIHGITSSGMQIFFSDGYGGNFLDQSALSQCGYFQLLEEFEQTLVDRGFLQNMVALVNKGNTCITPPNLHDGNAFSKESAQRGMQISSERTLIEQAIQCIRGNFKWFNSIPVSELREHVCKAYQMVGFICNFIYKFGDLRNGACCQYDNYMIALEMYEEGAGN